MSQQINLYNPLLLKQQKLFSLRTMAQALGLILLGNFLFYGYASYRTANLRNRQAKLRSCITLRSSGSSKRKSKRVRVRLARYWQMRWREQKPN